MIFVDPRRLSARGIMGMNRRNISYIGRYNPRSLYKQVDDKLITKQLALKNEIATPDLIAVVREQHEIEQINQMVAGLDGFCIKPAQGSGGKGILVITKVEDGRFFKPSGDEVTPAEMTRHCSNILAGLFSLGGKNDVAVVEALIRFDPVFDGISYEGVPDIRLIIFKGFPVMGMLRCSTHASDGKANLHQGAVGIGVDIATGRAIRAVQFDEPVTHHPDTGEDLFKVEVPHWDRLLELASGCYEMSGLGYLGTDMVLDRERGPLLLELNARPGLAIQIANDRGLLPRLRKVESLGDVRPPVSERIAMAKEWFGEGRDD
ncbi:alpha-L-glutamate ligase-like protein [Ferrimonas balearica DSM 9799]|uniref:Alpha-L-glutamate ligase-like protein n=1 Tax=Ferrimonas balearica (strain DSM 9799 / CCM 4581 / KCTC 23876 / PAT) TaxID=550540 RepID=E1SU85_FERBD|nr:alpha-L-glutamate ligase-like protein [Ferrimonas balearica]ADN76218.1 alpha-L-glutamate ligase-like protein [Ferrimonas balearica DSM 9799]